MDMTSTMGTWKALISCDQPPISEKRSRSPKVLNWFVQKSDVIWLLLGMPSKVVAGMSSFLPPWTMN